MKKQLSIAALGLAFTSASFAQDKAAETPAAEAPKPAEAPKAEEKPALSDAEVLKLASHFFGFQMGTQLGGSGLAASDFNQEELVKGFNAGLKGAQPDFTQEQIQQTLQGLQKIVEARDKKIGEENLKKEEAFLAENAKKEGIKTTESGLQYQIIKQGEGKTYEAPKDAPGGFDMQTEFVVNYTGTLIDGTEFDKSPEGEPAAFGLQVVEGFGEALKMMPVGSKWKIFIPSKLGYGEQRRGAKLGPNSTLIFEVELTDIRKRELPQGGMPFQLPQGAMPQGHPGQ